MMLAGFFVTAVAALQGATLPAQSCTSVTLCDFESWAAGSEVLFRNPRYSLSTSAYLAAGPDIAAVVTSSPAVGVKCYQLSWAFVDTSLTRWVRVTTYNAPAVPNPTVDLTRPIRLRLRFEGPDGASLRVAAGFRETGTNADIGQDGGTNGTIEWVGATSLYGGAGGSPQGKLLYAFPGTWQTLTFNPATDGVLGFTGNGSLSSATGKGTLEQLALASTGTAGPFTVYIDDVHELCGVPAPQAGDFDCDADVDLDDFAFFQACMTGVSVGQLRPPCVGADFDCDNDVDQMDFGFFQRCLSGANMAAVIDCSGLSPIPSRPAGAITGSQFVTQVMNVSVPTREQMVLQQVLAGNIPPFMRQFVPVTVTATIGGAVRTARYEVMPDYLCIGSDSDFFRIPTGPLTAQAIGDAFQCIMPTRKMVNDIYAACSVKLGPRCTYSPSVYDIMSVNVFNLANQCSEQERDLAGAQLGQLTGGTKKDVVITKELATHANKVAIYGWHQLENGVPTPLQSLYLGHGITYMDYSHGIRMVKQRITVDGIPTTVQQVLVDPTLNVLLSDEEVVSDPRYRVTPAAPATAKTSAASRKLKQVATAPAAAAEP